MGGSDLPGTVVDVTASGDGVQLFGSVILGPDEAAPRFLDPTSMPPPGAQVDAGRGSASRSLPPTRTRPT